MPFIKLFREQWLAGFVLLAFSRLVCAMTFAPSLDDAQWETQTSPLECQLSQSVPAFGVGIFSLQAGDPLRFTLESRQPLPEVQQVQLDTRNPSWKQPYYQTLLTRDVVDNRQPLHLEGEEAGKLLEAFLYGYEASISVIAPGRESSEVVLSPVNFATAYQNYRQCLAQLLPVNFEQIARSAIFFDTNKQGLSEDVEAQLELIANFVLADKRVSKIYIDGHTDNQGDRQVNINLSRLRANEVAGYLTSEGIPAKMLVTRYHADKYPVMDNDTAEGRARNRRVTVRLERE